MAVSNGLLTATCDGAVDDLGGQDGILEGDLGGNAGPGLGGDVSLGKSRNGQFRAWASFWRKTSSAMPRSRQIKASNDSCEPLAAATRQALLHSSNCSGVARPIRAKNSFSDTKPSVTRQTDALSRFDTRYGRESCVPGQRIYAGKYHQGWFREQRHRGLVRRLPVLCTPPRTDGNLTIIKTETPSKKIWRVRDQLSVRRGLSRCIGSLSGCGGSNNNDRLVQSPHSAERASEPAMSVRDEPLFIIRRHQV